MMRRLEVDALKADLATLTAMLTARTASDDPIGHFQLSERKAELEEEVARLEAAVEHRAKVALFFGGRPVVGSRGIVADFAGKMLEHYQDIVSKRFAAIELPAPLGARGTVPLRSSTQMLVTEVARGSFGFVLEEADQNEQTAETRLKQVVTEVSELMFQLSQTDEEGFDALAEILDDRLLISLRAFFKTLDDGGATMRLVDDHREFVLHREDVERARVRADSIESEEKEVEDNGVIYLLPESRRFEFKSEIDGELKKGTIAVGCIEQMMSGHQGRLEEMLGRRVKARFAERTISQPTGAKRKSYRLVGVGIAE